MPLKGIAEDFSDACRMETAGIFDTTFSAEKVPFGINPTRLVITLGQFNETMPIVQTNNPRHLPVPNRRDRHHLNNKARHRVLRATNKMQVKQQYLKRMQPLRSLNFRNLVRLHFLILPQVLLQPQLVKERLIKIKEVAKINNLHQADLKTKDHLRVQVINNNQERRLPWVNNNRVVLHRQINSLVLHRDPKLRPRGLNPDLKLHPPDLSPDLKLHPRDLNPDLDLKLRPTNNPDLKRDLSLDLKPHPTNNRDHKPHRTNSPVPKRRISNPVRKLQAVKVHRRKRLTKDRLAAVSKAVRIKTNKDRLNR